MSGYTQGRHDGYDAATKALMPYYSAALDEIYRLRVALVVEAENVAENLEYKTFPKSMREPTKRSIARMKSAAIGRVSERYSSLSYDFLDKLFNALGARRTLTRHQWEQEVDARGGEPR